MRYRCYGVVQASKYLGEFEAESVKEAAEMALLSDEASVSFCHQCAKEAEDPEILNVVVEPAE